MPRISRVARLRLAQLASFVALLLSFDILHDINANGLSYFIVLFCIVTAFYTYAAHFRCPRCGARLFPPARFTTPLVNGVCRKCGFDTSLTNQKFEPNDRSDGS